MGWLNESMEGKEMEQRLSDITNGMLLLIFCGLFLLCGMLLWIHFSPTIHRVLLLTQGWLFG